MFRSYFWTLVESKIYSSSNSNTFDPFLNIHMLYLAFPKSRPPKADRLLATLNVLIVCLCNSPNYSDTAANPKWLCSQTQQTAPRLLQLIDELLVEEVYRIMPQEGGWKEAAYMPAHERKMDRVLNSGCNVKGEGAQLPCTWPSDICRDREIGNFVTLDRVWIDLEARDQFFSERCFSPSHQHSCLIVELRRTPPITPSCWKVGKASGLFDYARASWRPAFIRSKPNWLKQMRAFQLPCTWRPLKIALQPLVQLF